LFKEYRTSTIMEQELKFTINQQFKEQFKKQLYVDCFQDDHYKSNEVFSVYFDTLELDLLMGKASSDFLKTKLRLRWYDNNDQTDNMLCYLELKEKVGSSRKKQRLEININKHTNIQNYLKSAIFTKIKKQFIEKYCSELSGLALFPHVLINYKRSRLIDKFHKYRISFDTDIMASSFLNRRQIQLDQSVFEIKGKGLHELPINLRNLSHFNLKKAAFSKYYECCDQLNHYNQ